VFVDNIDEEWLKYGSRAFAVEFIIGLKQKIL